MVVIMRDAIMPDCCNTCVCSEGYGCGITGTVMTTKEMESRPDWCPLEVVEPCEDAVSRKKAFEYFVSLWECIGTIMDREEWEDVCKTTVNELSSVQPEIIRCKDCKHYYYADNRIPQEQRYVCDLDSDRWNPDDYCSYAERKDEVDSYCKFGK